MSATAWNGFWEQSWLGRQPMHKLHLRFDDGAVSGEGVDIIGEFSFQGRIDADGSVTLIKQYRGAHNVVYAGGFDGEGAIAGVWRLDSGDSGPFVLTMAARQSAAPQRRPR